MPLLLREDDKEKEKEEVVLFDLNEEDEDDEMFEDAVENPVRVVVICFILFYTTKC